MWSLVGELVVVGVLKEGLGKKRGGGRSPGPRRRRSFRRSRFKCVDLLLEPILKRLNVVDLLLAQLLHVVLDLLELVVYFVGNGLYSLVERLHFAANLSELVTDPIETARHLTFELEGELGEDCGESIDFGCRFLYNTIYSQIC